MQARKHNQFSAIKRLLRKTKFRKHEHFMISKLRYLSFLETKICFKTLNLWNHPKVMKFHEKLSRKRWQVINFSPLSFQNSSKNALELKLFNRFYIWYLKLTSRFKIRTLKLAFSKFQHWSNTKVKKTYKFVKEVCTCNKALKHPPQILFCLLTTPYSHGNVVVQTKKGINNSPHWLNKISRLFSLDELTS